MLVRRINVCVLTLIGASVCDALTFCRVRTVRVVFVWCARRKGSGSQGLSTTVEPDWEGPFRRFQSDNQGRPKDEHHRSETDYTRVSTCKRAKVRNKRSKMQENTPRSESSFNEKLVSKNAKMAIFFWRLTVMWSNKLHADPSGSRSSS